MAKPKDITGQRFGRLVAIKSTGEKTGGYYLWLCECDCGNDAIVRLTNLTQGRTSSCGCLQIELSKLRGKSSIKKTHQSNIENDNKEHTRLSLISKKRANKNNGSGIKGVCWDKNRKMWKAHLYFKGERVLSERFSNKQDAIDARKEAEEKYFKPILEKYRGSDG